MRVRPVCSAGFPSADCPKNTYQNIPGQGSCINCPSGRWTNLLTKRTNQDACIRTASAAPLALRTRGPHMLTNGPP